MRFAIRLIDYLGDIDQIVRLARLAEEAGFEQVWFPHDPFLKHPWVVASAVALATERIGVGVIGTGPYTMDPAETASFLGTLDEISNGRALSGFGMHTTEMFEWTGHDTSDYVEKTRKGVALIRRLFKGEVVKDQSDQFHWTDQCYLRFDPPRDHIPIYVSPFGPDLLRLSGEIGEGSMPMIAPPESASYMVKHIHEGAEAAGRDPGELVISGCAWLSLSDDEEAALAGLRPWIAYFGPYMEEESLATVGLSRSDFDEVRRLVDEARYDEAHAAVTTDMLRLAIYGTPDQVIEKIELVRDLGITQINLGGPLGPDPEAAVKLLGEKVIPAFRGE